MIEHLFAGGHTKWQFWHDNAPQKPRKYNLKCAFIRDWFQRQARGRNVFSSGSTPATADFKFRVSDGKHQHDFTTNKTAVSGHTIDLAKLNTVLSHAHTATCTTVGGGEAKVYTHDNGSSNGKNANLPPYLTCYIWKRIS
jgi:hypothetical protein